jgi:Zn finger protein HypA/HybF involved in hydrogenase expression
MDELMLDGNAVAGMLGEVFAVEMTTAIMTCGNCGRSGAVGGMQVFRGAGIVMRCPNCDNAVAKIVEDATRIWMNFGGMQALEITR